ncbi:1-acyl-sn-glycerol-3-phosphate acyltransferase [Amphibacillus marinus]|uniref:1-acyl-sn-glycerol-3-phosphate acyltransferase n=1 Tax=Amphibacillus marinus TaxID=872970 RepID=A0A1H8GNI3_9BACI|nr:lysophospholipid acyltransferase family protein [Amphibacillus marinus]SEN45375.1 1-acyl-sn-glycerol-3-phosphate acyltransferase [Amphibacillus marinus]
MITANKSANFEKWFFRYLKYYLIKRQFSTVMYEGDVDTTTELPILYIANHSSWWDGLFLFYVTYVASDQEHFAMMDQNGLEKYPFFRKLGAFSVNRDKVKDLVKTFHYLYQLLDQGHRVWLFPQGNVTHQDKLPYQLQSGLGRIIQRYPSLCLKPVTFHYYFAEEQKPKLHIEFGQEQLLQGADRKRKEWSAYLAQILTTQYEHQREKVSQSILYHRHPAAKHLITSSRSTSDWLDMWKGR